MAGERGQTSAELLGVLLIVSAIVAAVAATPVGANIAGRTKELVCKIGGQECAYTPQLLRRGPSAPGGPLIQGPPIGGGRTFNVLPFPGSVSANCTIRNGQRTCVPSGGGGVHVDVSGEVKLSRSKTALDETGCPHQTLSVSTTFQLTGSGGYEGSKAGGSLSKYFGHSATYSVTVSPDAADAIASHDRDLPNPMDPSSLQQGESIELTKENYDGLGLEANYRQLQIELGYDTGTRVSSGITRTGPSTLRIYVGDEDFVRAATSLGVNFKGVNVGINNSMDLSHGKLHSIDVNINTPEGWAAYQSFLTTGRLPRPNGTAVSNRTTADTIDYTGDSEIGAEAGGFGGSLPLHSTEGHVTTTHNPDGSVTTVVSARYDDTGVAKTTTTDGHGHVTGTTRSLLLHDVDPSLIAGLYNVVGQTPPSSPGHDLRLDFTEAQLRALQQYARNIQDGPHGHLADNLLAAKTPDDMLLALYHAGIDASHVLAELDGLMSPQQATKLPGTVVKPSC